MRSPYKFGSIRLPMFSDFGLNEIAVAKDQAIEKMVACKVPCV